MARAHVTKGTAGRRVHTRTSLRIPIREQWYPDAPEPAVARTHPSQVVVGAALRRVSSVGRRPGSRSGYRPRAGSACSRFRANDCRGGASERWELGLLGSSCHPRKLLAGCGSGCLDLGYGSPHVLEAPRLISVPQLCTNRSGCTPVIPALAMWRQEYYKFNVILENLRHSGSLWYRHTVSRVMLKNI